jgi:hypothetical protein
MTQGVLLFAQNNSIVDYTKLAVYAATRVKEHLNKPVCVVTNNKAQLLINDTEKVVDCIVEIDEQSPYTKYFYDGAETSVNLQWNNTSRSNAFLLSPYDETLVIDVDYIINSPTLQYCWLQPQDFLIYKHSFDIAQWRDQQEFDHISQYSIPFYWATAFWFRKNKITESFFELVSHIKTNWHYYKYIYQIHSTNFRNDFGFSIALHMMNGFDINGFAQHLPSKMFYITDRDYLTKSVGNTMHFLVEKEGAPGDYIHLKTNNLDMHVMNKFSLLRCIENV